MDVPTFYWNQQSTIAKYLCCQCCTLWTHFVPVCWQSVKPIEVLIWLEMVIIFCFSIRFLPIQKEKYLIIFCQNCENIGHSDLLGLDFKDKICNKLRGPRISFEISIINLLCFVFVLIPYLKTDGANLLIFFLVKGYQTRIRSLCMILWCTDYYHSPSKFPCCN